MKLRLYTILNNWLDFEGFDQVETWMKNPNVSILEKMTTLDRFNVESTEIEIPDDLPQELGFRICQGHFLEFLMNNQVDLHSDYYLSFVFDVDKMTWAYNLQP